MKRLAVILLAAVLLCGCANGDVQPEISETSQTETTTAATETTAVTTTAEKVTTARTESTTVTTEEAIPLTPLEEARAWADEYPYRFLYDFTGDGFPERVSMPGGEFVEFEGYITSSDYGYKCDYICSDGKIYVCRDNDGRIFIASCSAGYGMAGCTGYYASRYDFYSNCVKETVLGEAEVFFSYYDDERLYYRGIYEFLGEKLGENETLENRLIEYISQYKLLDTIVLDYDYENCTLGISFGAGTDFAEEPSDNLPEYETYNIIIGGFEYESDFPTVWIDDRYFENGFDYGELNNMKNLDYISFQQLSAENIEKAAIKRGEWCGKVKEMYINAAEWGSVEGFSELDSVEKVIISGNNIERADLEFLKDIPSVRYIFAYFTAASAETFIPLSEMQNLEAIIDSGHMGCMLNLSEEEQEKVMELLPKDKYFWGMVK